ncbi:MAG: TROVE domain protein [Parcubacteria group bacterium GW2011_GWA1_38_7]|nr:MAG: TROVE domain protein [Parcubacteria group bacterium GW2011_GWA1_38_7]
MRRNHMNTLLTNANDSAQSDVATNYEGGQTFNRSLREQVVQALCVGRFGDTFYASKLRLEEEALEVLGKARVSDPEFLARAIVYGREKGFLKDSPITGLAILSGGGAKAKPLFEKIFNRVIQTPDDLRKFVTLCKSGTVPGVKTLGGYRRSAVKEWVSTLSGYHAVKYGSRASKGFTLQDIVSLTHPETEDAAVAERLGWLKRGRKALGSNRKLNPQIRAAEALKLVDDGQVAISLIRSGKLPAEFVIPASTKMTTAIWRELLHNAPIFNLLRNLVTFTRHDVFKEDAEIAYAVERLTNVKAIEHSKILPFRFFDAWKKYVLVEGNDSRIADALRTAANLSFVNMPTLGGRTVAIGSDVSGSMGCPVSPKGQTQFIDIAGIFTGAILRQIEGRAIPLPFQSRVIEGHGLSGHDDVLVTAEKVSRLLGGGTALGAPIQHLLDRKIFADVFVGITDNEDWAYGSGHHCHESFLELWRKYRAKVNPKAQAFVIQIAPYKHAVAPTNEPGVHFIYGWSDTVVRYIPFILEGGASQVQEVEGMSLDNGGNQGRSGGHDHAQADA